MSTMPMRPANKLAALLTIPAAFVIAFLLAFLAMGAADAFAQPTEVPEPTTVEGERPPHGFAPPDDEGPPGPDDAAGKEAAGADIKIDSTEHGPGDHGDEHGAAGGHGDPSEHFNFFSLHYGKDVAGGKYGDGKNVSPDGKTVVPGAEEPMSAPFMLMLLNFALLLALLIKFGAPAARKLATERHDLIKNALDEAAKLRKQAADKLAEYEARLKDADTEIKTMVEGMRKDAEADKARILENAAKQSATMKREAEQRIAAEIELARATLTREVTAAAAAATEKLLREKMMPGDQNNLVNAFIKDVQAQPAAKERV